jgi:cystathionine beta-lyase
MDQDRAQRHGPDLGEPPGLCNRLALGRAAGRFRANGKAGTKMSFDFDTAPSGKGHFTQKWDDMAPLLGVTAEDAIPMWVADMDFPAAPCIRAALQADLDRGFMGYFAQTGRVTDAVTTWMSGKHGWSFDASAVRYTHGVVAGFATVVDAFSDPGDSVVLFSPVYHSFYGKLRALGRGVVESPLVLKDGRFEMDLEELATRLTGRERIVVLCSPHNPGGRIWSGDEIQALATFCEAHDLILLSDEIHMDLTFPGVAHLPTAVAAPLARPRLVTITAASKGFNIAGGETGFVVIEDETLMARFDVAQKNRGGTPNRFGMLMLRAAFAEGGPWSDAVRAYLAGNFALWRDRIGALPGIGVMDMTATYLSWVDFRDTGCSTSEIDQRLAVDARIAKSPGAAFGTGGEGWNRFNLAMPRARLEAAIGRIETAFADLQ